jgi:hypothetical protein
VTPVGERHDLGMRHRGRAVEQRDEMLAWIKGFGEMLQSIDARLEAIVKLLRDGEDEPEDQP